MNPRVTELTDYIHDLIKDQIEALYLVGGVVRDDLIQISCRDIDMALNTGFENMWKISALLRTRFQEKDVQYIETFHNVKLRVGEYAIDMVPFRKETYTTRSNYPFIAEGTFIDDVLRRDFTINSIYMKYLGEGRYLFIDPLHGINDLSQGVIKLNYPGSFQDDPTRIIRLYTYAHRLGFRIEAGVLDGISPQLMDRINPALLFSLIQGVLRESHAESILSSLIDRELLLGFGISRMVPFECATDIRACWRQLLEANPQLIKTFEDLGIYSKLLGKKRKG